MALAVVSMFALSFAAAWLFTHPVAHLRPTISAANAGLIPGDTLSAHVGKWTYNSSACTSVVDPINVVFVQNASFAAVELHANDHGGWTYHDGSSQHFIDHGVCRPMDGQSASNIAEDPGGRFHMRLKSGTTDAYGSVFDVDPTWGVFTTADAHHEDMTACGHAVDDQSETGGSGYFYWEGGFNRGRSDVLKNWWDNSHHSWVASEWWGNDEPRGQCALSGNVAWSDGFVYYIGATWDYDADGVADLPDNCPDVSNAAQSNTDRNFVSNAPSYPDDLTYVMSDGLGDACDTDDDNDGRSDSAETQFCGAFGPTDPLNRDTDNDLVLDGAECALNTNPNSSSSKPTDAACGTTADADGDHLRAYQEFCRMNTSDTNIDSDGDRTTTGAQDGCEAASLNNDRVVTSGDQLLLAFELAHNPPRLRNFDINKDGGVNAGDLLMVALFINLPGQCP